MTFITSGPLVAMVLEGESAISAARQVIGATNPLEATTGSIRGDYAIAVGQNMVHGSDAPESAAREVGLFFPTWPRRQAAALPTATWRPPPDPGLALAAAAGDPGADRRRLRGARPVGARAHPRAPPTEVALENAYRKAAAVAAASAPAAGARGRHRRRLGREIYGKPRDAGHAAEMLGAAGRARATWSSAACA